MTDKRLRKFLFLYTILFAFLSLGVFFWYLREGKLLMSLGDGWQQHYKFLVYYSQYLRKIIRTLISEHRLVIPQWEMALGEGNDVLQIFNYYGMGSPFECLSFLVPANGIYIYYTVMILLRMYLSGLAFAWMFRTVRKSFPADGPYKDSLRTGAFSQRQSPDISDTALLEASLAYAFCFWNIYNAASHPFFLDPLIYLPVILGGAEKIIRRESPLPFMAGVFFSSISNLYFFYMIVLLTVIVTAVRLGDELLKDPKTTLLSVLRIFIFSLVAVLLGAFVWMPVMYAYLNDTRSEITHYVPFFYDLEEYRSMLQLFVLPGVDDYWVCGGFGILGLFCVILLFLRKGRRKLKILFLLCLLFLLFPFFAHLFNAMGYVTNRWVWFIPLVMNCILAEMLPSAVALFRKETLRGAFMICSLVLTCATLLYASYCNNAPERGNYVSTCVSKDDVNTEREHGDAVLLRNYKTNVNDTEVTRYETRSADYNNGLLYGQMTPQCYWSMTNPSVQNFRVNTLTRRSALVVIDSYDERMITDALAGVRYFITPAGAASPASYMQLKAEDDRYSVFENPYYAGLSYTCDSYAPLSAWKELNCSEKEEALLFCAVLDDEKEVPSGNIRENDLEEAKNGSFLVGHIDGRQLSSDGTAYIDIPLNDTTNGEKLLVIRGLEYQGNSTYAELCATASSGAYNYIGYRGKGDPCYAGVHDFAVNLYSTGSSLELAQMHFLSAGTYTFESIDVYSRILENDLAAIAALKGTGMENTEIGTDRISGTITVPASRLLCLSVPYSTGWKAYLDGKEVNVYQTDLKYMSVEVPEGTHELTWVYERPLGKIGLMITLFTLFALLALAGARAIRHRKYDCEIVSEGTRR